MNIFPKIKILIITVLAFLIINSTFELNENSHTYQNSDTLEFADHWKYNGIALQDSGYTIWGASPIMDSLGKTHLFAARWPCNLKVDPGWRTHSEIAHYIADKPNGPFRFNQVIGRGKHNSKWNSAGFHNPSISRIDDNYIIVYIANDGSSNHGPNQRIGMLISKSLYGPWKETPDEDEPLLRPPDDSTYWCYNSGCGVNNPTLIKHPNGKYYLYFKAMSGPRPQGKISMGLAISEKLEGPYIIQKNRIMSNDRIIEDGFAFYYKGKICLLTTDNHGMIEEGGGILWYSEDGMNFNRYEKGFHRLSDYVDVDFDKVKVHYGPHNLNYAKIERPQILIVDEKPKYLYGASGINIYGGDCTVNYVFKFLE
ncbi:MAG: hypothetical protein H6610_07165 [Ignavibacteriales bacterium]|nr:hypothetical protein [Ignavibacteriales bacterium]MCB9259803.1 hypothetical protein [Ignavibacteriales bacterium]